MNSEPSTTECLEGKKVTNPILYKAQMKNDLTTVYFTNKVKN